MKRKSILHTALLFLFLATTHHALAAGQITGTVRNGTTGKPSANDEVVLLKLSGAMQEVFRTKTAADGAFTVTVADPAAAHLVRVIHQGVNYHRPAPPGATSIEVEVFDAAENVSGIMHTVNVMRVEADSASLRIVQMFVLVNRSSPGKTLRSKRSLEFAIPDGAELGPGLVLAPGGMPINALPEPTGEKNHYAFSFPVRPGETRFQISYTLPYNGAAEVKPVVVRGTESFAVSLPDTIKLTPGAGSRLTREGEDAGMMVFAAQNIAPGDDVSFKISGTGTVPKSGAPNSAAGNGVPSSAPANQPGGGMAPPVNTDNPLSKYQWIIAAALLLLLAVGGALSLRSARTGNAGANAGFAGILKEELYRLESDKLHGRIAEAEYAEARAALDVLIRRAAAREFTQT